MNNRPVQVNRFLPRIADVLFAAVLSAALLAGNRMLNVDGDIGRHLAIGNHILSEGQIPTLDLFSNTMAGEALVPHEWLAQVLFAGAWKLAQLNGVVLLTALALAGQFSLLYRQALRRSGLPAMSAALVLLAVAATSFHWLTRPHILSYLMLVIWMEIINSAREGRHGAWKLMPAVMLIWVNMHGGFVAGFAVWGMVLAAGWLECLLPQKSNPAEPFHWKELLGGGILALLVSLINPSGWRIWELSLGYLQNRYLTGHTWEYLPPDLSLPLFWPFLLAAVGGAVMMAAARKYVHYDEAALFITLGTASLLSARLVPIFILVVTPFLARWLGILLKAGKRQAGIARLEGKIQPLEQYRGFSIISSGMVVLACLWTAATPSRGSASQTYGFSPAVFPVEAQAWLDEHPQEGNMFNYFPWGGYLLYENWPGYKVFIDGQTDFYGEALTRDYESLLMARPGWQALLEKYEVQWILLPPGEPLVSSLAETADWDTLYSDDTAVVMANGR